MGLYLIEGLGTAKDETEAAPWMRIAAESGMPLSQYLFGIMHLNGDGVAQDFTQAVKWWRKSAEQGFPNARNNLAIAYEQGDGVTRDFVTAYMWYGLALERLDAGAYRDDVNLARDRLAIRMTEEEIAEAERRTAEWVPPSWR